MNVYTNELIQVIVPFRYRGSKLSNIETEFLMSSNLNTHGIALAWEKVFGFKPKGYVLFSLKYKWELESFGFKLTDGYNYAVLMVLRKSLYDEKVDNEKIEKFLNGINEYLENWRLGVLEFENE